MNVRKQVGLFLGVVLLSLAFAGVAQAWTEPQLNALCAPDANRSSWSIILHEEDNQVIEFAWDAKFKYIIWTNDFKQAGTYNFDTDSGLSPLYARYASDHHSKTSAEANTELCVQPTGTPVETAPPTQSLSPSASPFPSPSESPINTDSPTQTPNQPTPTPSLSTGSPTTNPTDSPVPTEPAITPNPTLPPTDTGAPSGQGGAFVVVLFFLTGLAGFIILTFPKRRQ